MNLLIREYLSYNKDTGDLTWIKKPSDRARVGAIAGSVNNFGYMHVGLKGKQYKIHRVAWFLYYGVEPTLDIDHINGDRSDNRISNLRELSRKDNQIAASKNRHKNTNSKGFYFCKAKELWHSWVKIDGTNHYIGRSTELFEIACRRQSFALKNQSPELLEK